MDVKARPAVNVTVTVDDLRKLTDCSKRMTHYADPDGSCLIIQLEGQDNTPVNLYLARGCLDKAEPPFDSS